MSNKPLRQSRQTARLPSRIVIDSTVLFNDPWMKSVSFQTLISILRGSDIRVLVPRVTVEETAKNLRSRIERLKSELVARHKDLNKLSEIESDYHSLLPDPEQIEHRFRAHLQEMCESGIVAICELPAIDANLLLARAVSGLKPFKSANKGSDNGFKDALIWETLVSLGNGLDDRPILFVTRNKSDFAGDDDHLHPDLIDDLATRISFDGEIRIASDLSEALDIHIRPHVKLLDARRNVFDLVRPGTPTNDSITQETLGKLQEIVGTPDFQFETEWVVTNDGDVATFFANGVLSVTPLRFDSVSQLNNRTFVARGSAVAEVPFESAVFESAFPETQRLIAVSKSGRFLEAGEPATWFETVAKMTFDLEVILEKNNDVVRVTAVEILDAYF